ncbi:probable long-chain-alcohol O-fatty-acyltransferase 5 [Mercurialis annua]|uniref:probable long-chain-alcohol O-fatty-acyltransferase 5 n=1 Tax=Mercurialis annua TaxID=3986 RepID=UPI00215E127B|nr:probable long-chain-alcohol O-fatty-acyltransferase 5 [Mercurialis annua]
MENEISNFIKVWLSVLISLSYCYVIGHKVPNGTIRLVCLLPIISLFLYLPLHLSTMHLGGPTCFSIAWLANFKLLLFAFGKGPLSSNPSLYLPHFIASACLPINIQEKLSVHTPKDGKKSSEISTLKALLVAIVIHFYDYSDLIHPKIIPFLYCIQVYVSLELVLAMMGASASGLGLVIEPQFNEPYLSTSLQDFWGRRWNLVVPSILRPTVYKPTRNLSTYIVGRKWAPIPAILVTFLVSGMMHELVFYYLGREKPTWELTCFFVLHGFCLAVEVALKKATADWWQLPWLISGPLTIGFMMVTGFWLFLPSLHRCKAFERSSMEYDALVRFLENASQYFRITMIPTSVY